MHSKRCACLLANIASIARRAQRVIGNQCFSQAIGVVNMKSRHTPGRCGTKPPMQIGSSPSFMTHFGPGTVKLPIAAPSTVNAGVLYLRMANNTVLKLDAGTSVDDSSSLTTGTNTSFSSVIQWPYLDAGALGINKMMVGVDIVGDGSCYIQVGFDQADKSTFNDNPNFATSTGVTTPYFVAIDDTVPGEPLPIPCNAPSYTLILTFPSVITTYTNPNNWTWEAANLYLTNAAGGGATG